MPALRTIDIPFPLSTAPGIRRQESAGRIINGYVEPLGETAATRAVTRRAPGLRNFGTTTRSGFRGGIEINGILYCAFNGQLEKFTSAGGASVNVGALTGTSKGFFARNNATTPDQVFVDPNNNIAIFTPTTVTNSYPDLDLPAVNSVTSIDGYFVFTTGSGRAYASDLNSTAVNALSFGTAEFKPDGLTRAIAYSGQLFLFGGFTTEIWSDVGATPFPFQRATVISRGIAGPYCVAGFEDFFGKALVWIGEDSAIYRLNGYQPEKISPPDLDGLIEAVIDKTTLEMSVYMSRGHAFVLVSSPTWSWVFDLNTDKWAERDSYNLARSRIIGGVPAFGKWMCGDFLTGNIHQITNEVHTEPPRVQAITGAISGTGGAIRLTVANAYLLLPTVNVRGVLGTVEANNTWPASIIDSTHLELAGSHFLNAYISGGIVSDAGNLPFRTRIESGPVEKFPIGERIGRADFNFVTGVGVVVGSQQQAISMAGDAFVALGASYGHQIYVKVIDTSQIHNSDAVKITGVGGTTEANGTWPVIVFNQDTLILQGSTFVHPYTSGGILTNLSPLDPIETDPSLEISWSDDGGQDYSAPVIRKLGQQSITEGLISLVSCTGRSRWNGRRWRIDIADPVFVGFLGATQSTSPLVRDM